MKLSLRNLLIILIVLLAGFLVVNLTKRDGKSKSLRSELVTIDTAKVTRIEISSPNNSVELIKSEDTWEVTLPGGNKSTKESAIESALDNLISIKPSRLASRKRDKWKDYQVDSTGTRVKVFQGDEVATDIVLGRFGVEGQRNFYSFVRLFDDENVYVANNFMKMSISENPDDYREDTVIRLEKDSLTQISFNYPEGTFSLLKTNDRWFLGEQPADSAQVASFFQSLRYTTSKNYFDDEIPTDYTHSVTFSFSDRDDIIIEGAKSDVGSLVKSSENDLELFDDSELWDKVFKQPGVLATTLE